MGAGHRTYLMVPPCSHRKRLYSYGLEVAHFSDATSVSTVLRSLCLFFIH